jgi:hypothetical protein
MSMPSPLAGSEFTRLRTANQECPTAPHCPTGQVTPWRHVAGRRLLSTDYAERVRHDNCLFIEGVADGLKLITRDDEKDLGQIVHPFLVRVHNGGSGLSFLDHKWQLRRWHWNQGASHRAPRLRRNHGLDQHVSADRLQELGQPPPEFLLVDSSWRHAHCAEIPVAGLRAGESRELR